MVVRNRSAGGLLGVHLIQGHLSLITSYPVPGDDGVKKVQYTAPGQEAEKGRVWINKTQYFECVPPEVWEFHIGGYEVTEKWLKDRKGRTLTLTLADMQHCQGIIAAFLETGRIIGR